MKKTLTKIGFVLMGLAGLLALLCAVAASCVTNSALMEQGFLKFSSTKHLGLLPSQYKACAQSLCDYLDGKKERIPAPKADEAAAETPLFSEKEMRHLADVRRIIAVLKGVRWLGGGAALLGLGAAYYLEKWKKRTGLTAEALRGFAGAAGALLLAGAGLAVWGCVNFQGLFWTFHQLAFSNSLWLLNPQTDLLMALMPLSFFTWYAGQLLKSLLPVLGVMLCLVIAWIKVGRKQAEE